MARTTEEPVSVDEIPEWQQARRQRIIDAATELLYQQPYDQIQIRDIAKAANVALGTLYRYFTSKEHLYAVTLGSWSAPSQAPSPARRATAERRLRAKIHLIVAAFQKYPHFFTMQLTLQASTDPLVKQLLTEHQTAQSRWMVSDLEILGPKRAAELADMIFAITHAVLLRAAYLDRPINAKSFIGDKFVDLIAPELAAAEARARVERGRAAAKGD
ncbi:TetR/AcrR family transcriptional regulator [Nocardia sp. alder85J]|uniref:TetR/AcrR family transcriptional regulator n=1 Tax=Nocardia sp. alder85J TaxID=2862949 RepID=UPI001CD3E478|nr:TetR/AcrR family transcriptional regulator [Nocardia sp. alder85J]MCX4091590.1 helix-turn-helix domain containing protein [Nocardia sp. alder85J]